MIVLLKSKLVSLLFYLQLKMSPKTALFCGIGSRGDLQPVIAVALEFQANGWTVKVASEERNRSLVEITFGLTFERISGDSTGIIFEPEYAEMLAKGKLLAMMRETAKRKDQYFQEAAADFVRASEHVDLIVSSALCFSETYSVAELRGVPWVPLLYGPTFPTAHFPLFFVMESNWFHWLNKATYSLLLWGLWKQEKSKINGWRHSIGLPPIEESSGIMTLITNRKLLTLGMFDPTMCPGGQPPPDWPEYFKVVGFAFADGTHKEEQCLEEHIEQFLQAGTSPVYLGFGSMPAKDPLELWSLAHELTKKLGCRAVVCAGWSDIIADDSSQCLLIKQAPHHLLLPRCSVIVHHCGVGTCAASLRSGRPQVGVPVMLDQPHNALHMASLGVAPKPIPRKKLNSSNLAAAVIEASKLAERAQQLSQFITTNGAQLAYREIIQNKFSSEELG